MIKNNNVIRSIIIFSLFCMIFLISQNYQINEYNVESWKLLPLLLIFIMSIIIRIKSGNKNLELNLLLIFIIIGALIIIICDNLLIIYLGIELQTFCIFILIASNNKSIKSSESSLKYFILGALSSGFYLLGFLFIFMNNINLNINSIDFINIDILIYTGYIFIICSILFKLSIVPFHFWIPDIYEGSSWNTIIIISTISKISILTFLLKIIINNNLIIIGCLLSIMIGTLGAINQTKIKRLIAYSSITHIGFISLGLSMNNCIGYEISFTYLIIYMLGTSSMIVLLSNIRGINSNYIVELSGFQHNNKIVAISFSIILLSMAGIPPLSGFISKWFIINNLINYDYFFSSILIVISSIIGVGFYLRLVKILFFQKSFSYFTWKNILSSGDNLKPNSLYIGFNIFFIIFLVTNMKPLTCLLEYYISYFH